MVTWSKLTQQKKWEKAWIENDIPMLVQTMLCHIFDQQMLNIFRLKKKKKTFNMGTLQKG